ncbi:MBL fold metallo-hydrolase [Heliobacterium undosum]|uniref:MBL fold metallo-hydrolase n=1 Tax=Heliomicrobium undosum TaxID=121734 RepID=A0A845L248_9FIRM|nr:MBL fold metallo-hydrolase [Heliomicrobium undosum]MZP28560.1 MBL fold metallo-hydrolase [Heliomicrobium undosum]
MKIRLIRHATVLLDIGGQKILVDPMLSPARAMEPVVHSPNRQRNPLVELPLSTEALLDVDAVLLTHTHRDHFDDEAAKRLPKDVPVFCQPSDEGKVNDLGFASVHRVDDRLDWGEITLIRTGGQHGRGEMAERMGPVSGYVIQATGEPSLYIAGDTVWCPPVEATLDQYRPAISILYGGAAQFLEGGPITMAWDDVLQVCRKNADMKVVVIHLEAFNHCLERRSDLKRKRDEHGLSERISVPLDGELLIFPKTTPVSG